MGAPEGRHRRRPDQRDRRLASRSQVDTPQAHRADIRRPAARPGMRHLICIIILGRHRLGRHRLGRHRHIPAKGQITGPRPCRPIRAGCRGLAVVNNLRHIKVTLPGRSGRDSCRRNP